VVRIALTGGIATGKSYVATRLREAGVPVVDADVLSREVVASGTTGLEAIRARFGASVIAPDGSLDRKRLADVVFRDAGARHDLESIIHPAVRAAIEAFFAALPSDTPFAVADIPLLFETGREGQFDVVILAACSRDLQVERVMARDAASRQDAERRIAAQWPIEEKVPRADYVIWTGISAEETDWQVAHLLDVLRRSIR
jgi:dephospho-CoA kinase